MKKIFTFVLCLLLCTSLFSCDKITFPAEEESTSANSQKEEVSSPQNGHENQNPIFSSSNVVKNQFAKKAYEAVVKNEKALLFSTNSGVSEHYFCDIFSFGKYDSPKQAIADMDKDGVEEMLFRRDNGEATVLLHYENGKVYGYSFSSNAMRTIYSDGSFSWCYNDEYGYDSGISRISFVDGMLKFQELSRAESDYTRFYLNGVEVSYEKYEKYHNEDHTREEITFYPLDLSLFDEGKALEIASKHWGIKQGDFDEKTGYRYRLVVFREGEQYRVCLHRFVMNSYYEHLKCVIVDVDMGEISIPTYPDAKG